MRKIQSFVGYAIVPAIVAAILRGLVWLFPAFAGRFQIVLTMFVGILAAAMMLFFFTSKSDERELGIDLVRGLLTAFVLTIVVTIVLFVASNPMFHADRYANRIDPQEAVFEEAVAEFDVNTVQTLDKDAAKSLGDRTFGTIGADRVSQFAVEGYYTQQVYNGKLVRVTPAGYSGMGAAMSGEGTPGYIVVDVVTGESKFVETEPMRYIPSAVFGMNLGRRFSERDLFANRSFWRFEIDEAGKPYFIATSYRKNGLSFLNEVDGIYMADPVTGDIQHLGLDEIPEWIDIVYPADVIQEHLRDWGKFQNGWKNSWWGKKGVVSTTSDYAYLMQDDDLYYYTGITSASNDESNVGFVYVNMRTQECKYISEVGAEEYSAKDAAEGAVQQMGYTSVFPVMTNVDGRPTYFLSLKDKTGLIKAYAFVDYADYTKVKVTESEKGVEYALNAYRSLMSGKSVQDTNLIKEEIAKEDAAWSKEITISDINAYVIDGNTFFFITSSDGEYYMLPLYENNMYAFLKKGDTVSVTNLNAVE